MAASRLGCWLVWWVNMGLVHYYFGTMDEVLCGSERFTARLIERLRVMYEADVPFVEKWRTAMG